jgi:hypothetical protein
MVCVFGLSLTSCSGGGGFGGESGGKTVAAKKSEASASSQDEESATPPAEVSGAFLACGYMDRKDEIKSKIQSKSPVDMGCGFYRNPTKTPEKVDMPQVAIDAKVLCADGELRNLNFEESPESSGMHVVAQVDPVDLPCIMQVGVKADGHKKVAFRRSMPTVTQFAAKDDFNVTADAAALAEIKNSGTAGTTATAAQSNPTNSSSASVSNTASAVIGATWGFLGGLLKSAYDPKTIASNQPKTTEVGTNSYSDTGTSSSNSSGSTTSITKGFFLD